MTRYLTILLTLLISTTNSKAQDTEFTQYSNGLIYSDTTMRALHHIVDSLNIKYKKCDNWKTYYSTKQAEAYTIHITDTNVVDNAANDIINGISYNDFIKKYSDSISTKTLVTKSHIKETKYKKEHIAYYAFSGVLYNDQTIDTANLKLYDEIQSGAWVYSHYKVSKGYGSLIAFYFPEGFSTQPIPDEYARMIQYVDCMIDTNTLTYFDDATYSGGFFFEETTEVKKPHTPAKDKYYKFLKKRTQYPKQLALYDKNTEAYWKTHHTWDQRCDSIVKHSLCYDAKFLTLLKNATNEAIEGKHQAADLENYAELYYSPAMALALKRSRMVMGGCSQDQSPRNHALHIAQLSAKAVSWEVFLRAHLDIMNDNFTSVAYSNAMEQYRMTYIKEIEDLQIDVLSLIIGIALDMQNPSGKHYFGDVSRLGRAITESNRKKEFETKMEEMIQNEAIDIHNRIRIYYMHANYAYSTLDNEERLAIVEKNKELSNAFPEYMSKQLLLSHKWQER